MATEREEVSGLPGKPAHSFTLRGVVSAAAFTNAPSLARRWSRKVTQSTPPPLPLISLPPDDDWEEFDVPVKTGFAYTLPDLVLEEEETHDASAKVTTATALPSTSTSSKRRPQIPHDRAAICRILSDYMAQNEAFQVRRHGFGIDTTLVYKRTKSGANKPGPTSGSSTCPDTTGIDNLVFDAFFESGNLDRAYRVLGRHYAMPHELVSGATNSASSTTAPSTPSSSWASPFPFFVKVDMEYDLYCDADVSTHGHIQWYFFRVTVLPTCFKTPHRSSIRVRFNFRNMLKKASLYNDGMLPAVYVDSTHSNGGRGWHHAGTNVCYFKNADTYRNRKSGKAANFYTLSFVYDFILPAVTPSESPSPLRVCFAHCYPYTYSRLQRYLLRLQKDPERNRFFRRRVLCKTIAGNICDVLTITDFGQDDEARSGIVLTARVHPGESNASFLMHGVLDFLTGPSREAQFLRHRFVFKIVPMLNPDGVIHGNYRCSLAGTDLNRRYMDPSPELHPTIYATKQMLLSMTKTRVVSLYCDLHGHSRKKNMFLYGCVPFENDTGTANARSDAARLRLFPHVLSKTCGFYSFSDGTFSVSKLKKGTGRVVVWDQAHVLHSFTLEASFFGVGVNKKRHSVGGTMPLPAMETATTHFMPHDLRVAGVSLCVSLIPFSQLLDRDSRPSPSLTVTPIHEEEPPRDSTVRTFSPVHIGPTRVVSPTRAEAFASWPSSAVKSHESLRDPVETKLVRLTPLPSLAGSASTPFLLPRSPSTKAMLPTDSPSSSPRPPPSSSSSSSSSSFASFFNMDTLLTSLPSTDDLLREIEETLPDHYARTNDSDDDNESAGSESDPSGDNMEPENLQRQAFWKALLKDTSVVTVHDAPPKLLKNRSQTLLKRFSDSMLRMAMPDDTQPIVPAVDSSPPPNPESVMPSLASSPIELITAKPLLTLAPVRALAPSSTHVARRHLSTPQYDSHPRDRNKDIAALHLRAVQRRSRAKRTTHRIILHEQELL